MKDKQRVGLKKLWKGKPGDAFAERCKNLPELLRKPRKIQSDYKGRIMKIFIGFFAGMLVLTLLSRSVDSLLVPKVKVGTATSGKLSFTITGEGTLGQLDSRYVEVPPGFLVEKAVKAGTQIEEGQGILTLKMSDLEEKKGLKEAELKKLQLSLEQAQLNAKEPAKTTEEETAQGTFDLAQKAYDRAAQKLREGQDAYESSMAQKNQECDEKRAQAQARLNQASGGEPGEAEKEYDAAIAQIDAELQSYEQQQEAVLDGLAAQQESAGDALEQAQNAMDLARQNDENARINRETADDISKNNQDSIDVDIDLKKQEIQKIQDLIDGGGEVKAPVSGRLAKMQVIEGGVTTGSEIVEVGTGRYQFTGNLTKEDAKLVSEGDKIEILTPKTDKKLTGTVANIQMAAPSTGGEETSGNGEDGGQSAGGTYAMFTADLDQEEAQTAGLASYKISKESDKKYSCLIPVDALRSSGNQLYCLIVEKKPTVLGEEETAVKVPVIRIDGDQNHYAVEDSTFTLEDQLITESNKSIKEGDRVRVE